MYSASQAFHDAVAQGKPQKAMLFFSDAIFTNEDIDVSTGITLNDYFTTEDDLAIGQALSNELSFTLFNDSRLLNDYTFGDFLATIGAQTEEKEYPDPDVPSYDPSSSTFEIIKQPDDAEGAVGDTIYFSVVATGVSAYQWQYSTNGSSWNSSGATGNKTASMSIAINATRYGYSYRCKLTGTDSSIIYSRPVRMVYANEVRHTEYAGHEFTAFARSPYFRYDNSLTKIKPGAQVLSMFAYENRVYCYLANGTIKIYNALTGNEVTGVTMTNHAMEKLEALNGEGAAYENKTLRTWTGHTEEKYEFVPLGYFIAKRPNVPDVIQIDMHCNDFMTKFDDDMPTAQELGITYPTTISNLFVKMCQKVNVQYASSTFINSTATIETEPEEFENATMRQVMQWIAEAAASNLRFNRDGQLVFDWLRTTAQTFDEGKYSEFAPYWYETPAVDKLYNRSTQGNEDITVGNGENAYLIQDNPLLKGVTASA